MFVEVETGVLTAAHAGRIGASILLFDPLPVFLLILWVYFCISAIHRIECLLGISYPTRLTLNLAALIIGPVLLLFLWIGDLQQYLQQKMQSRLEASGRRVHRRDVYTLDLTGVKPACKPRRHSGQSGIGLVQKDFVHTTDVPSPILALQEIGLSTRDRVMIESAIGKLSGMLLICGPAGSGKTTSLYALLSAIDRSRRSVMTAEEGIGHRLPDVHQQQIAPLKDEEMAGEIAQMIKHDPDVIGLDPIPGRRSAEAALHAVQTGHLVLGTLTADSGIQALTHLLDLHINPPLIACGVDLVLLQRLVRRICPHCRKPAKLSAGKIAYLRKKKINPRDIMEGRGCPQCGNSGYLGRVGVFDVTRIDPTIQDHLTGARMDIHHLLEEETRRMRSKLRKAGMKLVVEGITTLKEIQRVTASLE